MKTLYISDLDGTLLRSNESVSDYTVNTINRLTDKGMIFSYATARSLITAKKVTKGINAAIPLIVYNGTFIMDNVSGEILAANYFDNSVYRLIDDLINHEVYPLVYSFADGIERFSFVYDLCSSGMKDFLNTRPDDPRTNPVKDISELKQGNIFYITCIDEPEKLEPLYKKYSSTYHCIYQADIYSNEQWLEFIPINASKASAAIQLKKMLGCDRIVAFGDGTNDIEMFEAADECYAVENAHEDLKKTATGIIASNNEDSVAKWLEKKF